MAAEIIDGRAIAGQLRSRVREAVAGFAAEIGMAPSLAVVLVGDDPASQVYVRTKTKAAAEVGIVASEHRLPASMSEAELLALIDGLNAAPHVHGILVQLPLPRHIPADRVIARVDPRKDVDGLHPQNAGRLATGQPAIVPCTPRGALLLIRTVRPELAGLDAVVIGRSVLVGRPMAQLLLGADCTVTIAHSRTRDLPSLCRRADILVAAAGRPRFVQAGWIRPGGIVIDVGINRETAPDGAGRLVGDVDFEAAREVAGAITPVPGGVGPMTVAVLLENTLACARLQNAGSVVAH